MEYMDSIKIKPSKLHGKIVVPPSKSLSHRAIICASLCNEGESIINNLILSEDIKATVDSMKKLGAEINIYNNTAHIKRNNFIPQNPVINCHESGSTLRFLIPISIVLAEACNFTGSKKLFERPLDVYYKIFETQHISYNTNHNYPLTINGKLSPATFTVSGSVSSQFISGLLFSLPLLVGDSKIVITDNFESRSYVNLTIDVIEQFGVHIEKVNERTFFIKGRQKYKNALYTVGSDYSQAAFFLVAKALENEVECIGLNVNSMQGDKEIINIINKYQEKDTITIDASQIPDLVPIIAVLASLKDNHTTVIKNAQRLRIKESDRLKAISTELNKLGASIKETNDGLIINGKQSLTGNATVNSWNDHRIAMSLAIAATKCENEIILENHLAVKKSYPHFWEDYEKLGGVVDELYNRA